MLRTVRTLLLVAGALTCASEAHAQTTAFFYSGQPGAGIASGQTGTITSATATFQPISDGVTVQFQVHGVSFSDLAFQADPNRGAWLAPGAYESARRWPFNPFNGLDVDVNGFGCDEVAGRFVVLEALFAQDGSVVRFAADFEEHCDGVTPAVFGAIRYNSTISSLTPFGGQFPSYSLQFGTVTHGTVTGGGLSCGTGGAACRISLDAAAVVQLTATPDPGYIFTGWTGDCHGVSTISFTVYGPRTCGATFDTAIPSAPRTILLWNSETGDWVGYGQSDVYSRANSLWGATAESTHRGVTLTVTGITDAGKADWTLEFRAPSGAVLQPGTYTGATRAPFATTTPGIDIWGSGRGCNTQEGQFTVHEIEFGTGATVTKLAIDFEQHCDGGAPALTGTIEYNSTFGMPVVTIDRTRLTFTGTMTGATGFAAQTSAQTVRLTQTGGVVPWTASSNVPWLVVSPTSGVGSATLTVSVKFDPSLPPPDAVVLGSIALSVNGSDTIVGPIRVRLGVIVPQTFVGAPVGAFDTPSDGARDLAGSIPVTGWALDDVEVVRVTICRDVWLFETASANPLCGGKPQIYVGDAVFIDGARPDVQAVYPDAPFSTRAGWGYLLLTNFLPNNGNGGFTLSAWAYDPDGHVTLLGKKSIACDNYHALAPFGAIDTPGQGQVVSGVVLNYGWVLSPGDRRSDPPGGGAVTVYVDGAPVGSPGAWNSRSDLSALFPESQYKGVGTAFSVFGLDTTTLANGLHTISWAATDNFGLTSGIGSRFFTVSNGASVAADVGRVLGSALHAANMAGSKDAAYGNAAPAILGRLGFDLDAPFDYFFTDADGVITIDARELDRVELQFEPGASGVMITRQGEKRLPIGAKIDPATGVFTWAPGPGFVGTYEFAIGGRRARIVIHPKS